MQTGLTVYDYNQRANTDSSYAGAGVLMQIHAQFIFVELWADGTSVQTL